ncbi:MAG: DUF922 domain-containing protein [Bacteroidota bacterium]
MKHVFTILLLGFTLTAFAQVKCDSIIWKADRKLTWGDFQGEPVLSGMVAAKTHYDFVRTWAAHGFTLKTKMVCSFNPCKSWSRNKKSDNLLAHEQGHFDIAEYFRRLYNKRVAEATYSKSTIVSVMKSIYQNINTECETMQENYDTQTTHGLTKDKQVEWLQKIAGLLDATKPFDQEEVEVKLP